MRNFDVLFILWTIAAITVLGVGGQFLLSPPVWKNVFPNIWIAYAVTCVLPTFLLSIPALRWLTKEGHA